MNLASDCENMVLSWRLARSKDRDDARVRIHLFDAENHFPLFISANYTEFLQQKLGFLQHTDVTYQYHYGNQLTTGSKPSDLEPIEDPGEIALPYGVEIPPEVTDPIYVREMSNFWADFGKADDLD